jgi:hypothetical protein
VTRETFTGYLSRLSPHGVVVFHISNLNLDLPRVIAADAAAESLAAVFKGGDRANDLMTDHRANALVGPSSRGMQATSATCRTIRGWVRIKPDRGIRLDR